MNKEQSGVDSVFSSFLNTLMSEDSTIYNQSDDIVCKYFEMRRLMTIFFENITGIFLERKAAILDEGVCIIESYDIFRKWQKWYDDNKQNLIWVEDDQVISSCEENDYYCIDYKMIYPNKIRFKFNKDIIPVKYP